MSWLVCAELTEVDRVDVSSRSGGKVTFFLTRSDCWLDWTLGSLSVGFNEGVTGPLLQPVSVSERVHTISVI